MLEVQKESIIAVQSTQFILVQPLQKSSAAHRVHFVDLVLSLGKVRSFNVLHNIWIYYGHFTQTEGITVALNSISVPTTDEVDFVCFLCEEDKRNNSHKCMRKFIYLVITTYSLLVSLDV